MYTFELSDKFLSSEEKDIASLRKCFISTSEKSIIYLPYQDLYLNSALATSKTKIDNVYYFII